jgi:hypothetical protein
MRMVPLPARRLLLGIFLGVALVTGATACGTASHHQPTILPTASASQVTLTSDFTLYRASQPIGVTIQNTGSATYYAVDGRSECTILQLQLQVRSSWQNVMPCSTGQPVQVLQVAPHSSVPFTLAPGDSSDDRNLWIPGIYRVVLQLASTSNASAATQQVYSAGFQISSAT